MKNPKFYLNSFIRPSNYSSSIVFDNFIYSLYDRLILAILRALSPSCNWSVYSLKLLKLEWNNSDILFRCSISRDFMMRFIKVLSMTTLYIRLVWLPRVSNKLPKNRLRFDFRSYLLREMLKIMDKIDSYLVVLSPRCLRIGKLIQYILRLSPQMLEYPSFSNI